jgi:superfamily II DNA or RNA helicase
MEHITFHIRGGACIPWAMKSVVAQAINDLTAYIASGPPGSSYRDAIYFFQKDSKGLWVPISYVQLNDQWMLTIEDCRGQPLPLRREFRGTLRHQQLDVVDRTTKTIQSVGGATLCLSTGMGKTVCALNIAVRLGVKPLILVHKSFLLEQWRQRVRQFYGPETSISIIQGAQYEDTGDVVIAMIQSMYSRNYQAPQSCGLVIVDECHHLPAKTFRAVMMNCNTKYRLGLSATPERSDGLHPSIMLGPLVTMTPTLPDSPAPGVFTGPDFDGSRIVVETYDYVSPQYSKPPPIMIYGDNINHAAMLNIVAADATRTENLAALISRIPASRHILCLVHRKQHATSIAERLEVLGIEAAIFGPKSGGCPETRVVISTFVFASEGFDEKRFDTMVLASPASDVRQAVGRILRKMEDPTHKPVIIDIVDQWSIFKKQAYKRRTIYRSMGCTFKSRKLLESGDSRTHITRFMWRQES